MLVDSHCHLTGDRPGPERLGAVLERARLAGLAGIVVVGTDMEDSRKVLSLLDQHAFLRASLGVHPHEARTWTPEMEEALAALLSDVRVRFVGETGLDWHYDFSPRETQELAFRAQIRLAKRLEKPLMIHTREAAEDTLRVLREEGAESVSGIFHCFSEDKAFAMKALNLGFYLSFSGIVTFPRNVEAIREVAAWAPEDRILVETDSPYLAPVPHRGKMNEPAFVTFVADQVAALRGLSRSRLAEITTRNLEALCGWAPSS